jgi:hypothetical protein
LTGAISEFALPLMNDGFRSLPRLRAVMPYFNWGAEAVIGLKAWFVTSEARAVVSGGAPIGRC